MKNYYVQYTIDGTTEARQVYARSEEDAVERMLRRISIAGINHGSSYDVTDIRVVSRTRAKSLLKNTLRKSVRGAR